MIVITGAAGFIGSCLVSKLNQEGLKDLILIDKFDKKAKEKNYLGKDYLQLIDRKECFDFLDQNTPEFIFHLGARTDTTEFNKEIFNELNLHFTIQLFEYCAQRNVPIVYASSAATYGGGEYGYEDNVEIIPNLKPLNPYGDSKNDFDKWLLNQPEDKLPPFYAGLKFFNVYGPNEYHKGRMASVIWHAYSQIQETGKVVLFRSHNPDYKDGEQKRDFIYVKDVVDVMFFLYQHREAENSGIYNLGTGTARTFLDLAKAVFHAMNLSSEIGFRDTPADIRDKYQYFTEATMDKLRGIGYSTPFTSLEEGIRDYVQNYLKSETYL